MALMMAEIHDFSSAKDRRASAEEQAAFENRPLYAPTYCDFDRWAESEPPEREWAVDKWVGMGHVTLLAAKGGMGKSVLTQQMNTALSIGREFVSHISHPRTCLAWMGEDDDDELWRRQVAICKKFQTPIDGLRGRFFLESMVDTDCTLVANIHGAGMIRCAMLTELREQIGDLKIEVVTLDNIARLFAGNENDRHEVTAFLAALAWAANPTGAAILLVGHTAKAIGSEFSGNAAWENACRARLWLTDSPPDKKPEDANGEDDRAVEDLRYLSKRKVNYTSRDLCILRYTENAYDVVQGAGDSSLVASIESARGRRIVLAAIPRLETMGMHGTNSTNSPNFLPRLVMQHGLSEGLPRVVLTRAMRDLLVEGLISVTAVGQYANRTPRMGLKLCTSERTNDRTNA